MAEVRGDGGTKQKHWNAGPERKHWEHLYDEIVATEICVGCSACVVACPHDVIHMEDFRPVHVKEEGPELPPPEEQGPEYCIHGEKSCSLCAMACLRLEPALDAIEKLLYGRRRKHPSEPWGVSREIWLGKTTDPEIRKKGQDGGAVTAILSWMLENGEIQGACTAKPRDDIPWLDEPFLATTKEDLLASAGSRYTYCSSPLALKEAATRKIRNVAVVGVSCESTAIREMQAQGIKRWGKMVKFVAGLMCNETFKYEPFIHEIIVGKYDIPIETITKINVKGDVIVSTNDRDEDIRIPLDECRVYANDWCHHCPDFAAEHADISFGGIGESGWTICIIRSEYGQDVWNRAVEAGVIETKSSSEDPKGMKVLNALAKKQRRRVGPFESHAQGRWPVREVIDRMKLEYLEEHLHPEEWAAKQAAKKEEPERKKDKAEGGAPAK
jgi:coenzyme F420 hydrogenase subunit beta